MYKRRKRRIDKEARSQTVSFKVTPAEQQVLFALCERYNLTKAELLLRLILELNDKVKNLGGNK